MRPFTELLARKYKSIELSTLLKVCLLLTFSAFVVSVVNMHFSRDYTSDNVANQHILQSLINNHGGHALLPSDSFILHFPLYALTDLIIHNNTRTKLFLQALALGLAGLACIIVALIYYLKQVNLYRKAPLLLGSLVLAFIASTPTFAEYALEINHRLPEAGLALLLLLPVHAFLSSKVARPNRRHIIYAVSYTLGLSLLWFDDPYFTYVMTGGIGLTTLVFWIREKISWRRVAAIAATLLASLILTRIYRALLERLGIHLLSNGIFTTVSIDSLFVNIQNTLGAFFANFNGNLFGLSLSNTSKLVLITSLCGGILAIFALVAFMRPVKSSWNRPFALRVLFIATAISLLLTFMLTQTATESFLVGSKDRYLLFIPILLTPLMVEYIIYLYRSANYRIGQLVTAVLCVGLFALLGINVHGAVLGVTHKQETASNSVNYGLINKLEAAGYSKGYADYWDGQINTYLSNDRVHFVQVVCINGILAPYRWMVNEDDYTIKAGKTFYLLDPSVTDPNSCSEQNVSKQYGNPQEVIAYGSRTILLYDHDLLASKALY